MGCSQWVPDLRLPLPQCHSWLLVGLVIFPRFRDGHVNTSPDTHDGGACINTALWLVTLTRSVGVCSIGQGRMVIGTRHVHVLFGLFIRTASLSVLCRCGSDPVE